MSETQDRFTGRVADYERYRTRYPAQVIDILSERCGLTREAQVADIGAGTGMLSELFLEYGNSVVAIEPNDEMRAGSERLAQAWPGLLVKRGTAEATGLEDASVDYVVAGRAFHWFDPEPAKLEFKRILRPGGWVVLVTNSRVRDDSPQSLDYETLLREHGIDYKENRERYEIAPKINTFFAGGEMFRKEISGEQRLTLEDLIGLTQSLSVSPLPGDPRYPGMQKALDEFFSKWEREGTVVITTLCRMACGRFSPHAGSLAG